MKRGELQLSDLYGAPGVGSAFPTSPAPGQLFVRTDLDYTLFEYDSGRSKWLSVAVYQKKAGSSATITSGSYMRGIAGVLEGAAIGEYIPWDATVVGVMFTRGNTDTGSFTVERDGSLITGIAASTNALGSDMTLNANFNSGGIMACGWNGGGGANSVVTPYFVVHYRRRAT